MNTTLQNRSGLLGLRWIEPPGEDWGSTAHHGHRHPGPAKARFLFLILAVSFCAVGTRSVEAKDEAKKPDGEVVLIEFAGKVDFRRSGAERWDVVYTNAIPLTLDPGDQLRSGPLSRATILWHGRTITTLGDDTAIQIPEDPDRRLGTRLIKGIIHLFHRDKPGQFDVEMPTARATTVGTEFVVEVAENDTTTIQVLEGKVLMTNQLGQLELKRDEAGLAEIGNPPARTAALDAVSAVQWCLYYPAVLYLPELKLEPSESAALSDSLAAYRDGDLPGALAKYPVGRNPTTDAERIYLAELVLVVGQVEEAERLLTSLQATESANQRLVRLAAAIRRMIAIVKLQDDPPPFDPEASPPLATEWICESYYQQSRFRLEQSLLAAKKAVEIAPDFAFGWERVAELEFGFGRLRQTRVALDRSLSLAPRNAQAVALLGFVLAAENRTRKAIAMFDEAIRLDGGLGNAWLGRGLCRIRRGDIDGGSQDLLVAAAVEPQRALLRSYLGKAFDVDGDDAAAHRELGLAMELDPNDPTAWLYSALINQRDNRINTAIRQLEHSQQLNENRMLYRSRLLLDEDQAVRSANLASIYQDAGLFDESVREAVRAVNSDYANYSGHLFLANSYNALRDPNQVNLRYETPWLSEYLIANLLAPAAAGTFSQAVSQQEYSRLFERNRLGVVSSTEYLSRGDWIQSGSQFGILENSSYAFDAFYGSRNGQRVNDDQELLTLSLQFKQQITPSDTVYLQGIYYDAEGGDLRQYYDPADANPVLRTEETQEPLLLAGYHHEWSPASHTLVLAGWLNDALRVNNPQQGTLVLGVDGTGTVTDVEPITIEQEYRSELEIFTAEVQQILLLGPHTLIAGGRFQTGQFDTQTQHTNASFIFPFLFPEEPQDVSSEFERANAYLYYHLQVCSPLLLIGGVSYDWLKYPQNFRYAPISQGEETTDQISPKAGLIWTPFDGTTVRAVYAQSQGGVSFDQSFQLEPTQVAGFNQAWRSLIPGSVAGANSAERFETWGVAVEQKLRTGTYLGLSFNALNSDVDRLVGVYDFSFPFTVAYGETPQDLEFEERTLLFTLNQLLSEEWSFGVSYRLSQAELQSDFTDIPSSAAIIPPDSPFHPKQDLESLLHQVNLQVLYTHPCGFFGQIESVYYSQSNSGYEPDRPGDSFWQFNAFVGYRFARRHAEVRVGVLNITDQDYNLNPLNLTAELPRERNLAISFRFSF